jgi:hypothetical protein
MMSNQYSSDAQKSIDQAENKLGDAIKNLKSQAKGKEIEVEIIPEESNDVEVEIESSQKEPQKEKKEPRRSEFVETDDPKVLERINDLYRQVKGSDARNQMILDHNKLMEDKLAEYQEKLSKFEQTTKNTASDRVESELKTALRNAREESDFERVQDIEDKLFELRLEKRISDKLPAQEQKNPSKTNPQQQQFDAQYLRNAAYLEVIAQEKDAKGRPVRSYLFNGDPDNDRAIELFESIPREFASAGKQVDIKTIMDVMDERIRGRKQQKQVSVLGGDESDAPAKTVVRLTQAEINVARNMGITPERYARQKQLMT